MPNQPRRLFRQQVFNPYRTPRNGRSLALNSGRWRSIDGSTQGHDYRDIMNNSLNWAEREAERLEREREERNEWEDYLRELRNRQPDFELSQESIETEAAILIAQNEPYPHEPGAPQEEGGQEWDRDIAALNEFVEGNHSNVRDVERVPSPLVLARSAIDNNAVHARAFREGGRDNPINLNDSTDSDTPTRPTNDWRAPFNSPRTVARFPVMQLLYDTTDSESENEEEIV